MATVYIMRNTVDDRVYIGSTKQKLNRRLTEHKSRARKGVKRYYVYEVMREYGPDNFYIEPLCENVRDDDCYAIEQEEIQNIPDKSKLLNSVCGVTYTEAEYIVARYGAGHTTIELAAELHHDKETISRVLKARGVELRDWNDAQRIPIDEETLRRLYIDEFKTAPEIAAMYGTSHQTILKRLKKYGIPIRKAVNRKYLHMPPLEETQG